ncbi:hypothetical protein T484DRAFT_1853614 [Baffinella frigidus]|nr:hypothetical protein T484DRAFT_1853614 [Cryptophyta sp. CCMP2293]
MDCIREALGVGKAGRSKGGVADRRVSPAPPDPPNAALEAARPAPGGADHLLVPSLSGRAQRTSHVPFGPPYHLSLRACGF